MSMSMRACPTCANEVPLDNLFCGKCGNRLAVAPEPVAASPSKTMFFSGTKMPARAKLVVVKSDSMDGVSYQLTGTEHVAGREEGVILFPEDPLISPRHANFIYRDGALHVRDEGSTNGIFIRISNPVAIESGGLFLVGEQLLQIEASAPDFGPQPDAEGTYFYASPKRASKMRLIQRLRGGDMGIIFRARGEKITIGREEKNDHTSASAVNSRTLTNSRAGHPDGLLIAKPTKLKFPVNGLADILAIWISKPVRFSRTLFRIDGRNSIQANARTAKTIAMKRMNLTKAPPRKAREPVKGE